MFQITARSVLELGSELISSDVIAFYELIKNGFDAGTTSGVEVRFDIVLNRHNYLHLKELLEDESGWENLSFDDYSEKIDQFKEHIDSLLDKTCRSSTLDLALSAISDIQTINDIKQCLENLNSLSTISISDTGTGMSLADLQSKFLVIGTPSRKREVDLAISKNADKTPYLGEKGIGRLSAMRLGDSLEVQTARQEDNTLNLLRIDWNAFADVNAMLADIKVDPEVGDAKQSPEWSGTTIIIGKLTANWNLDRVQKMVEYDFNKLTDPFVDLRKRPKIAVYWGDGERVAASFLPQKLLESAHARVTGRLHYIDGLPQFECNVDVIDIGKFEHPIVQDVANISFVDLVPLLAGKSENITKDAIKTVGEFEFEAYWYNRRRLTELDGIGDLKEVKKQQEKWSGIMVYRDGFRVFPYGEDEDDWLSLDRKALRNRGYLLNKDQFVGKVNISRLKNLHLVDQTNREGLRETPQQQVFLELMKYAIQERLYGFMGVVEKQYKGQSLKSTDIKTESQELQKRINQAVTKIRKALPVEYRNNIDELEEIVQNYQDLTAETQLKIEQVEGENRQMIEMAGIGLMIEVVAHELARVSENALDNINTIKKKEVPDDIQKLLEGLRSQMKSLHKRLRILDPMSITARQRSEVFTLKEVVKESIDAHEAQFLRHGITCKITSDSEDVEIKAVKGMILQITENLITNSIYWLGMKKNENPFLTQTITFKIESSPPTIIYEDNGYGISPDNREAIFRLFFSLKEKAKRRGLGLFIARECAEYHKGVLYLDDQANPETKRLHRFILELPESVVVG
ncbi:sensor histidine kinase [Methylophilus sp. YYY-1]|uniref:sensor histidine kinase n=1 Tax=Methylophilus sp. YYY-1 TaxID=2682087 RepID=UPI0023B31639|nr:sensor histidine kinase [Methylophilus sp. YYY-1]MDF0379004.1 RstB [Methylophilus sp. YYY-1]